ncbi:MAG TPA: enoyl-CoA hydratase [Acidimicrobiia bacterium]|jgi:enoyl-CoA hydratase
MAELVQIETAERVRTVTLNRPEARNALSVALQREAGAALAAADDDDAVDVVILTGADPAFCAGLDLRELGRDASNLVGGADDPELSPFAALWKMSKPVIGAINGPCVTGGFELALACDFLIASEHATFGDTHARVGVMPAGGMSVFLPRVVGVRKAKEMSLSGNFVGAQEAFARGLVNHVVPHVELLPAARRLAADIAGNDQAAVRSLKLLYDSNEKVSAGEAIEHEQEIFRAWRIDPAEIERRRTGIVERGRGQQ